MKIAKLLLYPFAAVYNLCTRLRNYLYDIGHKPSFQFDVPIVTVGNLNVGGSGKTPMVEYLIALLKDRYQVVTLSRGYKRATKGYRLASEGDTATSIGDEPFQLFKKFGKDINVVVGEDRAFAIPHILQEFPTTNVILLDDGMQHRSVRPRLTILVTEYSHPFFRDHVLPAGRLRESRIGARRSDIIVVTKCNDVLSLEERSIMSAAVQLYAGPKPVFFSTIQYADPRAINHQESITKKIILVSGIAKAASLEGFCFSRYTVLKHFQFPDHHRYSENDLAEIESFSKKQQPPFSIITTEKDMVKLIEPRFKSYMSRLPWFYMPIQQAFLQDGLKFDELVLGAISASPGTDE